MAVQQIHQTGNKSKYEEWRKRGAEKLDYWVACERARLDPDPSYAGLYAEAVPSDLAKRLKEMQESGGSGQRASVPTDVSAPARRYLEVEGAFIAMAARSATECFGRYESLDERGEADYSRLVARGSRSIRALCHHVLVLRRPAMQFQDPDTFLALAAYGVSSNGFARWLGQRIDDVREFLGSH